MTEVPRSALLIEALLTPRVSFFLESLDSSRAESLFGELQMMGIIMDRAADADKIVIIPKDGLPN